jgi:hypothetical protein
LLFGLKFASDLWSALSTVAWARSYPTILEIGGKCVKVELRLVPLLKAVNELWED